VIGLGVLRLCLCGMGRQIGQRSEGVGRQGGRLCRSSGGSPRLGLGGALGRHLWLAQRVGRVAGLGPPPADEQVGHVGGSEPGEHRAQRRPRQDVAPVVVVVGDPRQRDVPAKHHEEELQQVLQQLGHPRAQRRLEVDGQVEHGVHRQAGVAAGEGLVELLELEVGHVGVAARKAVDVAPQVLGVLAATPVRQHGLAHGVEVRSQATDAQLREHRGERDHGQAVQVGDGLPVQVAQSVADPAAVRPTLAARLRQLLEQLHHRDHGGGHAQRDGDDQFVANGAFAVRIAEGLVAAEEAPPEGTHQLVEQQTGHAEGRPDQQVAEPAGQLRVLGHG